jgi:hypothetical protein
VRKVSLEHRCHFRRERMVGDQRRYLEVETERAVVEVRGADRRDVVVDTAPRAHPRRLFDPV